MKTLKNLIIHCQNRKRQIILAMTPTTQTIGSIFTIMQPKRIRLPILKPPNEY
jgi:hypothetical protein